MNKELITKSNAKPIPGQMFHIAKIGIVLAKQQGKMQPIRQRVNAHFFSAKEVETLEVGDEELSRTKHRFIGRVGRIGFRHWSMRVAEPYWVTSGDGNDDGYRASYLFEWTDREVIMAKRRMSARSDPDDIPDESRLLVESGMDVQPDFMHAVNQYETLSMADCERLISDMSDFTRTSEDLDFVDTL